MDFYENCVYGKQERVSFVKSGKEKKSEKLDLVHKMYGDRLRYLPLEPHIIMLHLLMTQLEKYGYISLDINLMYFKLLRTGNAWLKMRLVRN